MKSAKDYMEEANAVVERISSEDGVAQHGKNDSIFIDVRDSGDIAKTGTIAGALRIPRGLIEFAGDPAMPMFNKGLAKDKNVYIVCAAGGQAALAGKTMKEMGYESVTNIGGIGDWEKADGPMEKG